MLTPISKKQILENLYETTLDKILRQVQDDRN